MILRDELEFIFYVIQSISGSPANIGVPLGRDRGPSPALGVESGRAVLGPVPEPWKGLVAAIGAVAVEPSGLKGMVYLL